METLTDLIRSIPGAGEMSDLAMHITISAIMATLMFIIRYRFDLRTVIRKSSYSLEAVILA